MDEYNEGVNGSPEGIPEEGIEFKCCEEVGLPLEPVPLVGRLPLD